jgi:alpha-tubulin suppressor-like RCC1 family protein
MERLRRIAAVALGASFVLLSAACGARTHLLDDGAPAPASASAPATTSTRLHTIASTWEHTCAVGKDGTALCWGDALIGPGADTSRPHEVPNVAGVVEVSASHNDCARKSDGSVVCWGWPMKSPEAVAAAPLSMIAGGTEGMCGVTSDGQAVCNDTAFDPCGPGPDFNASASAVAGLTNVGGLAVGLRHACAFDATGTTSCWGCGDDHGFLEDAFALGTMTSTTFAPIAVPGVTRTVAMSGTMASTCAVQSDGSTWCWGDGSQFAGGITPQPTGPVKVDLPPNPVAISVGIAFTCAAYADGVRCIGDLAAYNDGCSMQIDVPQAIALPGVVELAVGYRHACARDDQSRVFCWGCNDSGQLGDGTGVSSATPVQAL